MKAQLEKRLSDLKSEFEAGQKMLAELETKRNEIQSTLLRISGAIQVLEELLQQESAPAEEISKKRLDWQTRRTATEPTKAILPKQGLAAMGWFYTVCRSSCKRYFA